MVRLKAKFREIRPELISSLLYRIARVIGVTGRITAVDFPEDSSKTIYCGWHGRSLPFANYFRNKGFWVIISQSRDGDMQNTIFTRLGFKTIRGSTGRNGTRAAIEGIRVLRDGGTMAITPDGPRGPSGVVQDGVMLMARKSGAKLVPVGISARPRVLINSSWDHYMLQLPFAKGLLIFGEPIFVPSNANESEVERLRKQLEDECHRLQDVAERQMGFSEPSVPRLLEKATAAPASNQFDVSTSPHPEV